MSNLALDLMVISATSAAGAANDHLCLYKSHPQACFPGNSVLKPCQGRKEGETVKLTDGTYTVIKCKMPRCL